MVVVARDPDTQAAAARLRAAFAYAGMEPRDIAQALASSLEAQQAEDAIRLAQLEEAVRALTATGHRGAHEATPER